MWCFDTTSGGAEVLTRRVNWRRSNTMRLAGTEAPTVSAGDAVTTGAVIGSVGQTAAAESGQTTHLHFAMYQDDTPVDPAGYLPEN